MPKIKNYPSVAVRAEIGVENTKVELYEGIYVRVGAKPIATFWLPTKSFDAAHPLWVPEELIEFRAKHDFKITFDHYSSCNSITPEMRVKLFGNVTPAVYEDDK